jgi:hypothetical protein
MKRNASVLVIGVVLGGCAAMPSGPDGGSNAADGGATGATDKKTADGGVVFKPELTEATAQVAGRTGRDLRISIKGKDRNLDVVAVWVRLLDAQGMPLAALDTNRDGMGDSSEGSLTLEGKKWLGEVVTGSAMVRGVFSTGAGPAQVGVALVDATSERSDEQVLTVAEQMVRSRGETCDPLFFASRCQTGLGCRGMPAVCDEGLAPQIGRMAFYRTSSGGPMILVEGTEPEDDLASVRFEFQNAQGQAISIDSDGDGAADLASFEQEALGLAVDGAFFLRMQSGEGLDQQVPKLVAIPKDGAGHTGMAKTVSPTAIPVRSTGQACDARGFDMCGPSLTCSPGIIGATNNRCASAATLRSSQCGAATLLVPTASGSKATGVAEGGSLWDAPNGCSTADPTGRPEGIVKVRLSERANKLTLSTIGAGTNFDTTLYVLPSCAAEAKDAMACSDDVPGAAGASRIVLNDLPAGDYMVIVDSFDLMGGAFELTATVE